ncbi:MAG: hypothetical protein Aureis2KO_05600 [Aureisphaera sp.]
MFLFKSANSQDSGKLGIDHIKFEKQWILKNLADEYFIEASSFERKDDQRTIKTLEKAYSLYKEAKKINYNNNSITATNYYFENYLTDDVLVKLVRADIDYRISLLEAEKMFWEGSSEPYETPESAMNNFKKAFESFNETANDYIKIDTWKDTKTIDRLEAEIGKIGFLGGVISYELEQKYLEEREKIYVSDLQSINAEMDHAFQQIKVESNNLLMELGKLEKAENSLFKNMKKGAFNSVGLPDLTEDLTLSDGLKIISSLELEDLEGVSELIGDSDGLYEMADSFEKAKEYYNLAVNTVKIGEAANKILTGQTTNLDDLISFGANVLDALEQEVEIDKELALKVKELRDKVDNQLETLNHLKLFSKTLGISDNFSNCLKNQDLDCINNLVETKLDEICRISSDLCGYNKQWNSLKTEIREKFGKELKFFEETNNILSEIDISSGAKILKTISKYTDLDINSKYTDVIDSLSQIKNDVPFERYYKIGESVFVNSKEFQQVSDDWIDFSRNIKPLGIIYQKFGDRLTLDNELALILFDEMNNSEKGKLESIASDVLKQLLLEEDEELNLRLFRFLLSYGVETLINRLGDDHTSRIIGNGSIELDSVEEIKNYLRNRCYENPKKCRIVFSPLNQELLEINLFKERNNGTFRRLPQSWKTELSFNLLIKEFINNSKIYDASLARFVADNFKYIRENYYSLVQEFEARLKNEISGIINSSEPRTKELFYDKIYDNIKSSERRQLIDYATKIAVGIEYYNQNKFYSDANTISKDFRNNINELKVSLDSDDYSSDSAFFEQALVSGLNYYLPGSGYVFNSVKSMVDIDDIIQNYERILNDIRNLEKQLSGLSYKKKNIIREINLVRSEQKLVEIRANIAKKKLEYVHLKSEAISESIEKKRALIEKILPRLFYLSELLRKRYASFNRAMLEWKGFSFYEYVDSNPENIRLAIDPDIRLYQWLELNNVGKRTDVYDLIADWQNINTLVDGLEKSTTALGQDFAFSKVVQIMPKEASGDVKNNQINIPISINNIQTQYMKKEHKLRKVLKTFILVYDNNGQRYQSGTGILLRNSGTIFEPQTLEEIDFNRSFAKGPTDRIISNLLVSCDSPSGLSTCLQNPEIENIIKSIEKKPYYPSRLDFFSYPLDAKWNLIIDLDEVKLDDISKIEIAFLYKFDKNAYKNDPFLVELDYKINGEIAPYKSCSELPEGISTDLCSRVRIVHNGYVLTKREKGLAKPNYLNNPIELLGDVDNLFEPISTKDIKDDFNPSYEVISASKN